jgi:hypothetical protein
MGDCYPHGRGLSLCLSWIKKCRKETNCSCENDTKWYVSFTSMHTTCITTSPWT